MVWPDKALQVLYPKPTRLKTCACQKEKEKSNRKSGLQGEKNDSLMYPAILL